ncbi:hypothetical protein [Thetidibacter halocola]|uniref:Uncharacterized protein n=1 Tax=Thetidibacter halocola TaxID=2827239 RepID=A0A8J7WBD7_9RHOB|nr:hypothetical protein [Thetidibacter halocola]MBS0124430.1 hypothetical protein [Thetidibacter halocola]
MKPDPSHSPLRRLQRAMEAHVYRKTLRDLVNRLRHGARAPLSDMAIYPRPRDVTHALVAPKGGQRLRRQHSGLVLGGAWDRNRIAVENDIKLASCRMRWVEGADWAETPIYRRQLEEIAQGRAPDDCRSREDMDRRFAMLDRVFAETKARGRMLDMEELPEFHYRRAHGATLIHVGRDGACLRGGGGAHRFAIAHILDLPEMPAQLGVVHPDAIRDGHLERLGRSSLRRDPAGAAQASPSA